MFKSEKGPAWTEAAVLGLMIITLNIAHALSPPSNANWNGLLLRLLYVPVMWAAVRGGFTWGAGSGAVAALAHSVVMIVHRFADADITIAPGAVVHAPAFFAEHWLETPFLLIAGCGGGYLVDRERRRRLERDRARQVLKRYMSPDVADRLLQDQLNRTRGGVRRKATILFADLRGFTRLTEQLPSETTVSLLNEYFSMLTQVVSAWQGTIDKFLGDGAMVLFGFPLLGPDDAARSVAAGVELQRRFVGLRKEWIRKHGERLRTVGLGVGIGTGDVTIGNVGSEKRMDYTAIGDPVNLASRLCGMAEASTVLFDRQTFWEAKGSLADSGPWRLDGPAELTVKGKQQPQKVYRLFIGTSVESEPLLQRTPGQHEE